MKLESVCLAAAAKRRLSAVQARLSCVLEKFRPENARRRDLARGADEKENEKIL